jgi:conjugative transposon TraM protein
LDDAVAADSSVEHTIAAVVQETQTVTAGSTVKLRLADDVFINGILVPKNSFVFGIASINGERLQISISSIQYQQHLLPVSLNVYDIDGLNGIYIPGSINRDVFKESANQTVNGIGLATLDPSLAAQATNAGIQAAKSLLNKKVKLVKITLKAGYKVLLKDNNEQH